VKGSSIRWAPIIALAVVIVAAYYIVGHHKFSARGATRGFDEMALEVAWIGAAAILAIAVYRLLLNNSIAARLAAVPFVGPVVTSVQTLVNAA
jgi:hypothetical protein